MKAPRVPSFAARLALDLFYGLLVLLAWPVLLVLFLCKRKWREGLRERMGGVPSLAAHPLRIWVHAISVGETEAARSLVPALRERFPEAEIVFSTTTRTGRQRAAKLFPELPLFHYPMDFPWSVHMTLGRIEPTMVVEVEPEWWPDFLFTAARRRIPVVAVNVRITEKAVRGYGRIRGLVGRMINCMTVIGVQNDEYAARLRGLGADADRIAVTGQMKYDNVTFDRVAGADALAADLGLRPGERVIVAGSTGPGEEATLLDAFAAVRAAAPGVRLAIVPRKPERFDEVAQLIAARGYRLVRRSETTGRPAAADAEAILLGDTMGELMKFYQIGCLAFIGRSLIPLGGSNPIDPASLGLPLVFGPHMFNFPEAEELFVRGGAARIATDAKSLAQTLSEVLQSPEQLAAMGRRAREAIGSRQGATARNVDLIARALEAREAVR
ncbi:MAG TPA: 3-deoxy-D-manno-octulosonic acid transferase [Phycisphaerae bacterium]|nr:3-deoxy-D-manno-octulosonic acid transferase [Phycisphaerae bacterium]HOI53749.1 3-deoxy-D-manno-octulosonic acid transferase [Phycisphaerae bacterium]